MAAERWLLDRDPRRRRAKRQRQDAAVRHSLRRRLGSERDAYERARPAAAAGAVRRRRRDRTGGVDRPACGGPHPSLLSSQREDRRPPASLVCAAVWAALLGT